MLKRFTLFLLILFSVVVFFSFHNKPYFSGQPPSNFSGAPGSAGTCANCHGGSGNLNTGGGSVVINGLPSNFKPGQTYPFTVTISHPTTRERWGFEINARNLSNNAVGTFSTTSVDAATVGSPAEIGHYGAVYFSGTSYTYDSLFWTAPSTLFTGDSSVTFYIAANAANGTGTAGGDYIYSNTVLFTLPVGLKSLDYKIINGNKVQVNWTTSFENNSREFIVERNDNNNQFYEVGRINASGNAGAEKSYSVTDNNPAYFNQPIYYRLKLVDNDNKFSYSKILQVTLPRQSVSISSLIPNQPAGYLHTAITSDKQKDAEINIISLGGHLVLTYSLQLQKGLNTYKIPVKKLSGGLYFFQLRTKENVQSMSFVAP